MPYVGYAPPPHTRARRQTTRPRPPGFYHSTYKDHFTPITRSSARNTNSSSPRAQAPTNTRASTQPVHPSSAPASLPPVEESLSASESPPLAEAPAPPSSSISGSADPASPNRDEEVVDPGRALSDRCPPIACRVPLFLKQKPRNDRCGYSACGRTRVGAHAGPWQRSLRLPGV